MYIYIYWENRRIFTKGCLIVPMIFLFAVCCYCFLIFGFDLFQNYGVGGNFREFVDVDFQAQQRFTILLRVMSR